MVGGGPQALKVLKDLKQRPGKADYGPALQWEAPVWIWFQRLAEHPPMGGNPAVRGEVWLRMCERMGWDVDLAFGLLAQVQGAYSEAKVGDDGDE